MVSRDPKVPLVVRPFGRAEAARLRAVTASASLELAKTIHELFRDGVQNGPALTGSPPYLVNNCRPSLNDRWKLW